MKNKMNASQMEAKEANGHFDSSMKMGKSAEPPKWEAKAGKGFPVHVSRPKNPTCDSSESPNHNPLLNSLTG